MTAQMDTLATDLSRLTRDNPYNLYNFEAKVQFSQKSTREFSHQIPAFLKGAAPSEYGIQRLTFKGEAMKGGEFTC